MNIARVKNDSVWGNLKFLFTGALLIFLVNIYFGFDNALTVGEIPRWQSLVHLHGGSVGWITLAAIGIAIWVHSDQRDLSAEYEKRVRRIVLAAVLIFAAYVPTFGLAFSRADGFFVALLPIFGSAAVIVLWVSALYAIGQLRQTAVVTTLHLLITGALLVAAIGATVGALLGLERVIGQFLPLPQVDRVGAHAGMMDTYLFLVASAIIEWVIRKDARQGWTWPGLLQAITWTVAATLVPLSFFLAMPQLMPIFMLLLVVGLLIFLFRMAWRAIAAGPFSEGLKPWTFFAAIWLILYMGLFLYAVSIFAAGGDFTMLPTWFGAAFAHIGFVGMMTNAILAVLSASSWEHRHLLAWGESTALWLINIGILAFVGLKITSDIRTGAILMGLGVLLGVYTMFQRLRAT